MPRQIEAVIFDLDDTLIDWSGQTESYGTVVRPHIDNMYDHLAADGHSLPDRDAFFACYRETVINHWQEAKKTWAGVNFGAALHDCFTALGLEAARIDLDAVMRAYDAQPIPGVALFDDTLAVLDTLRDRGYKLGLITNSMLPMWMRDVELRAYELLDYFDARITSGDAGYMKPHPAIYDHILEALGVTADRAVFIGDRPANDIAGANEVGLISVLMSPDHLDRELNGVQPDYIISKLSELLTILNEVEEQEEVRHEKTGSQ